MDSPDSHPGLTVALTRPRQLQRRRRDTSADEQHFFPSFAPLFSAPPPLGHSRPQLVFQEPSQRPSILRAQHNPFQPLVFGAGTFKTGRLQQPSSAPVQAAAANNQPLLGSGNFGVIRGGTFYNDADREASEDAYNPYYNGHGRPSFYGGASNPRPQQSTDFFANFRDFADINTPTKASFSQFYVVYVNKNASRDDVDKVAQPNNIMEQLKMLDLQQDKKKSVAKHKLSLLQQEKHNKQRSKTTATSLAKDMYEPLLALS